MFLYGKFLIIRPKHRQKKFWFYFLLDHTLYKVSQKMTLLSYFDFPVLLHALAYNYLQLLFSHHIIVSNDVII